MNALIVAIKIHDIDYENIEPITTINNNVWQRTIERPTHLNLNRTVVTVIK